VAGSSVLAQLRQQDVVEVVEFRRWRGGRSGIGVGEPGMIGFTLPEIRRLLVRLVLRVVDAADDNNQARISHYKRRGYPLT
jgi:hypothetical protein